MEFIEVGHNSWLVAISFVVALVSGATGFSLTKDLSLKSVPQRKLSVALAAIALGGGIWSMHFIAMLGLRIPFLFYYDAAVTLVSALIAILIVALALVLLHFRKRTKHTIVAAGVLVGAGILAMHYVGMAGMQICRPVYTSSGVLVTSVLAIGLCVLAFAVAYGRRTNKNIFLGTLCFGVAVFAAHFLAIWETNFIVLQGTREFGPLISNEMMAIGVILTSFVILGTFLWVGSTLLMPEDLVRAPDGMSASATAAQGPAPLAEAALRIPCDRDGGKVFISARDVSFVRADGHYTQVYTGDDHYFCGWPITEATKRLIPSGFVKAHRSYLVNPSKVARFERSKDKGRCLFDAHNIPPVPVSRSHLKDVEAAIT